MRSATGFHRHMFLGKDGVSGRAVRSYLIGPFCNFYSVIYDTAPAKKLFNAIVRTYDRRHLTALRGR